MNRNDIHWLALTAFLGAAASTPALAQTEAPTGPLPKTRFQVLEALPGSTDRECGALGMSDDGRLILGYASSTRSRAAREATVWRSPRTAVGLGSLATANVWGFVRDASPDGTILVGATSEGDQLRAFGWTESSGLTPLPSLVGAIGAEATATSDNGLVIAGHCSFRDEVSSNSPILSKEATVWNHAVPTGLGFLNYGYTSEANDVSADGEFVVGFSDVGGTGFEHEAFLWSAATGMVSLGDLPNGLNRSSAIAVSDDGGIVAGWGMSSSNPYGYLVWRWTPQTGLVRIGKLPGDFNAQPADMTPDGSVIVGWSGTGGGYARRPMIWDAVNGKRDLMAVLEAGGVDLSEWRNSQGYPFMEATGVSADGKTIVGHGRCGNFARGWVAILP